MIITFDLMEPTPRDLRNKVETVCSAFIDDKRPFSAWNVTEVLREHFPVVNIQHEIVRDYVHTFMNDELQSDEYAGKTEFKDGNMFIMYRQIVDEPEKTPLQFSVKTAKPVPTLTPVNPEQFGRTPIRNVTVGGVLYTMYDPNSSAFKEAGWNSRDCSLLLVFNSGHAYVISNISRSTWDSFKESKSRGTFYHERIKGNIFYPSREVVVF